MREGFNLPHFTRSARQLRHANAFLFHESFYLGHQPVIFSRLDPSRRRLV